MSRKSIPVLLLMAIGILALWGTTPLWMQAWSGNTKMSDLGDAFGGVNALFSGLAFVGVIIALLVQQASSSQDAFESRFFRLTDTLRSIISSFSVPISGQTTSNGKDVFVSLYNSIRDILFSDNAHPFNLQQLEESARLIQFDFHEFSELDPALRAYEIIHWNREDELGPYFRMLYHAIRFVERSSIKDKNEYVDLLRAELCAPEIVLIGLNCLTPRGKKLKPLVIKYGLLKHMPRGDDRLDRQWFRARYPAAAFEECEKCGREH